MYISQLLRIVKIWDSLKDFADRHYKLTSQQGFWYTKLYVHILFHFEFSKPCIWGWLLTNHIHNISCVLIYLHSAPCMYCEIVNYTAYHIHNISCTVLPVCIVRLWTSQLIIFIIFPVYRIGHIFRGNYISWLTGILDFKDLFFANC